MRTWLEEWDAASELARLPWEQESERLRWWLLENCDANPPPESADQLWFRIFANTWGGRVDSCDLELSGGTESDDYLEPIQRRTWRPENAQFGSIILPRIACSGLAKPAQLEQLCVAHTTLAVVAAIENVDERLILGQVESRGVTVGFAAGPGVHLGRFYADDWDRSELQILARTT